MCHKKRPEVSSLTKPKIATDRATKIRKCINLQTNGQIVPWLVDSGSNLSIINESLADHLGPEPYPVYPQQVHAVNNSSFKLEQKCDVTLQLDSGDLKISPYMCKNIAEPDDGAFPSLRIAVQDELQDEYQPFSNNDRLRKCHANTHQIKAQNNSGRNLHSR